MLPFPWSVANSCPRYRAGGGTPACPKLPHRSWLPQVCLTRLVAALVASILLPVLTAALICQVDCVAQALAAQGQEQGEHGPARHAALHAGGDAPAQHHGACHLAATPWIAMTTAPVPAAVPTQIHWVPSGAMRFASLVWPPPQQRPKAIVS